MPSGSVPVAVDAYDRPVASSIGSPSVSARKATTGPSPFSMTATTPVPPTVCGARPYDRRRAAIVSAVRCSCIESSGAAWNSR